MTTYEIEALERGTLLRNQNGWITAEFIGRSHREPNKFFIIKRNGKTGEIKRMKVTAIQLAQRFPKLVAEWSNPYCK